MKKEIIQNVYEQLRNGSVNPSGSFDKAGCWYAEHDDLINVRSSEWGYYAEHDNLVDVKTPRRAWKYSEMLACRTLKYVKGVAEKFNCQTENELLHYV